VTAASISEEVEGAVEWTGMKNVPLLIASQAIPSLSFVKIQNGSYSHAFGRRSNSTSVIVAACL
jgi:hypothetical protein